MNIEGYLVILLNFILIGLLPVAFFKKDGSFNLNWWLTALPFLMSIGSVTAVQFGLAPVHWTPLVPPGSGPVTGITRTIAVALSLASIALIMFTLGTHRIPIALWHQNNDKPNHIVTWGAYAKIRHPFYTSFLLAFSAAALYSPQLVTLCALLWGGIALNVTAAREETRLCQSEFGSEYQQYIERTGRFVPRI
jgi:protein-S-isoprenylcysteine O-methyltransferase Ste14